MVLYFAYGSNISSKRLQAPDRVPGSKLVGRATLQKHSLRFHKESIDGSAKCNALYTGSDDDRVLGVLFSLPDEEKPNLDRAEGLGKGYEEKLIDVELPDGTLAKAVAYIAAKSAINSKLKPFDWYRDYVLAGAAEHGLPTEYVQASILSVEPVTAPKIDKKNG